MLIGGGAACLAVGQFIGGGMFGSLATSLLGWLVSLVAGMFVL